MEEFFSNLWATLAEFATSVGLKLIYAILLLLIGLKIVKVLCKKLHDKSFKHLDKSVALFLVSALRITLNTAVIISAALVLGVPGTTFIAILGSAGLAVGLALQGSLTNIAGSIMIMIFKPFKVGDYVDVSGVSGVVQEINLFYTVIHSLDNKRITVPNGAASNAVVVDYSSLDQRRVDLEFNVAYGSDVAAVKELLLRTADQNALILKDPKTETYLLRQDNSSIVFVLRAWCKGTDYWPAYFSLLESVHNNLRASGIEIPFPQVDVHMR